MAAVAVLVPWSRVPRWTYILPPLAYFIVVALLRHSSEGSVSGYAPLALLPVIWIALNLGRLEVAIGIVAGVSVFVLPLFIDHGHYGAGEWRRALLWAAVALVVGFAVESIMRSKRRQMREAREQARAIAEHEQTMTTIAEAVRGLTAGDTRSLICQATLEVSGANRAAIVEPDGRGYLVVTARVGAKSGHDRFRMDGVSSGSAVAFASGQRFFVADANSSHTLPQEGVQEAGMVRAL